MVPLLTCRTHYPDVIGILHAFIHGKVLDPLYILFFGLETLSGSHFQCTAVNVPALHFGARNIGLADVRE